MNEPSADRACRLHPYTGQERARRERLGQSYRQSHYGDDCGGGRSYRFNRLGFRGPDFSPGDDRLVFVFGESHAFGYFVELEESWPVRFVESWRGRSEADPTPSILNFADVGASNASIARMVVTQCSALTPDLVLIHFADADRTETVIEGEPTRLGPWLLEAPARAAARAADSDLRARIEEQVERAEAYARLTRGGEQAHAEDRVVSAAQTLETLRCILLTQFFLQARAIPALACIEHPHRLFAPWVRASSVLGPLLDQLSPRFLAPIGIWEVEAESVRDGGHASPQRHRRFAETLLDFL